MTDDNRSEGSVAPDARTLALQAMDFADQITGDRTRKSKAFDDAAFEEFRRLVSGSPEAQEEVAKNFLVRTHRQVFGLRTVGGSEAGNKTD